MIPLTSIWERYFLKEMSKVFFLFLGSFYALYVLIDYSNHSHSFHNYHFSFGAIVKYYLNEFIMRMDTLIPFAVLIACIKTLCSLNIHNELVALMASGLTSKRLLFPFVFFGLVCTAFVYFNTEVLQPNALKYHNQLHQARAKEKRKKHHHPNIQQLNLEDNTSLIFQEYDSNTNQFFDAYWIRSVDDIYRMHHLTASIPEPTGTIVEHFVRNDEGNLIAIEFFESKIFPNMLLNESKLLDTVISPSDLSLSKLKEYLPNESQVLSEKEANLLTTYYYKLAMPWLCLLAIIAPAPFCTRFSRTLPVFLIYAFSLFGLVAFYLIMDAAVILGERQAISPGLAIWVPFGLIFASLGWRFAKV